MSLHDRKRERCALVYENLDDSCCVTIPAIDDVLKELGIEPD